ncbi:hypothetical protein XELAEV_18036561mg [Xenopus laevis]|uniref:Uncharacterized protein n=1 Tax=Xenopus laevis TaxID=8355 RepID=A0A974CJ12_XENLA|nr:hypothetical protein XELAEV_18036561mg [Xenopus laevis]
MDCGSRSQPAINLVENLALQQQMGLGENTSMSHKYASLAKKSSFCTASKNTLKKAAVCTSNHGIQSKYGKTNIW